MKTRRMFCALAALLLWVSPSLASWFGQSDPLKPPIIAPFEVQKVGAVFTTELHVVDHGIYTFILRLCFKENDAEDRKRVRKLAGDYGKDKNGKLIEPGVSIPLRLTISSIDEKGENPLLEREYVEAEMYSYGDDSFDKRIDLIELIPGRYRIRVESLSNVPELAGTPVYFGIGFRRK